MSTLSSEDKRGIDAIRAALVNAILAGDADAYAQCFTSDGILMHPDTPLVRGAVALREYSAQVFAAMNVTKLLLSPIVMSGTGGIAFEVRVQELAITPTGDKFQPKRQYLHVYRRAFCSCSR